MSENPASRSKVIFAELVALVPQDVLNEQVKSSFAKDSEKFKDEMLFPEDEFDKARAEIDKEIVRLTIDPSVPAETTTHIKEEFQKIFGMTNKTFAEFEAENPVTAEEIDELAGVVSEWLVQDWVNILTYCANEPAHNEMGRLNDDLLPIMSPSFFFTDSSRTFLGEITENVDQLIYPEYATVIYHAFKDKVKEAVNQRPDGLEVSNDLFIKKDENGYFVCRKA